MTSKRCSYFWRFSVFALGIFFITLGVYLYLNWIEMFTRLRGKEMALSPTSPSYEGWKISPLPLNFDVYLFNWTNPEDFYEGSPNKPRFEELGPYRFRENPDKVDINWHQHNHSVSFHKKASFHFDAVGSRGSLDDRITTVNTVAHAAALRAIDGTYFQKKILQTTLGMYKEGIAVTKTADEWMFTGYLDPLVTVGGFLSRFSNNIVVPFDRIGWLYTNSSIRFQRNDSSSYEGHFNMFTGADDIYKMGSINTWNYGTHNGVFPDQCGEVKGSMGEFFPPNLTTNDSIAIYLPNLCRSVPLDFTQTTEVRGIKAYKFSGGARAVDNGTLFPEAKCFCVNGKCEPSGVINITPCKYNSSIYMSYPHFYQADPSYLEAIEGLAPDKEKHEFFMTLEPNAGVPMDVGGGFQANYLIEPVPDIAPFSKIPRTFIPIMWCEERVRVSTEIATQIALVPLIILLGQIFTGILLAGGVILICWYPAKLVTQICHDPKTKTSLLNPLSSSKSVSISQLKRPIYERSEVPLLEYKHNGSIIRPNGTVTDGLLGNSLLRPPTDVIIR